MKLTEVQKKAIEDEYNEWFEHQYGGRTLEERKRLGQFFTPPTITIQMIERFETIENKSIFDPTCGAGNLLAGCIMAGANPELIYGNEYDEAIYEVCVERLVGLGVPASNLTRGDIFDYCKDDEPEQLSLWGDMFNVIKKER